MPPFAQPLLLLLCLGLGIAFFVWGPTRALKIAVAVLAVATAAGIALHSGRVEALGLLVLIAGVNAGAMAVAVLLHALPIRRNLELVDVSACPRHGRKKLVDWTRDFVELGFSHEGDYQSEWRFAGRTRKSFIRFVVDRSRTTWVELHVLDEPKMAARLVASRAGGEVYLATVDRQANEEFFQDSRTRVVRVASSSKCSEMLRRHEDRVSEASGPRRTIEDVRKANVEIYDGWIERLLQSRQLVARGSSAKIPLRLVPSTVLRVMTAWFH
jgi:hypothetical protein